MVNNVPIISVVAIPHSEFGNLYLHGKRRDNGMWSLPGGNCNDGELPHEGARRELTEETGLDIKQMEACRNGCFAGPDGNVMVHLFIGKPLPGQELSPLNDPDREFSEYKYLDPRRHDNMHIPSDRNILVQHMNDLNKSEPPEYQMWHQLSDKLDHGPFGTNFTVSALDHNNNVIGRAYIMNREHGITMHNFNHHPDHNREKVHNAILSYAEKTSGKKMLKPEVKPVSPEAQHFRNKYGT